LILKGETVENGPLDSSASSEQAELRIKWIKEAFDP